MEYSVKTTTSSFAFAWTPDTNYSYYYRSLTWSPQFSKSFMLIVPRSIFLVPDGDDRIKLNIKWKNSGDSSAVQLEIGTSTTAM